MAYVINCDCGYVVRGDTEDDLVAKAEAHIREIHPELVGTIGRDELLTMAEEQ